MYELNEDELECYRNNCLFRFTMMSGWERGLTKEEVLSELCVVLIKQKMQEQQDKLEYHLWSTTPVGGFPFEK